MQGAGAGAWRTGGNADNGSGGAAISRVPAPEERPGSRPRWRLNGFRCSAGARWQKNAFRCSFGRRIGSETGFGAVGTPSTPASAWFACAFRCKNNEKTDLAPPFWRPDGQNGESGPQSAAITAPKPAWLPGGSGLLHRNPFGCQMGCGRRAEPHPAAVRPAETAPGLARLSVSSSTKLIRGHRRRCGDTGRAGTSAGWYYPPKESRATGQLGMSLFSRLSSKPSASGAR